MCVCDENLEAKIKMDKTTKMHITHRNGSGKFAGRVFNKNVDQRRVLLQACTQCQEQVDKGLFFIGFGRGCTQPIAGFLSNAKKKKKKKSEKK